MESIVTQKLVHPLEPLNAAEIVTAVSILRKNKSLDTVVRFISVVLKEPSKDKVSQYHLERKPAKREAFAVLYDPAKRLTYEAIIDLEASEVTSWVSISGVQPTLAIDEQVACEQAVLKSPLFKEAMKEYGVTDMNLVMVDIWSAGYYGNQEEQYMRLARPLCFVRTDPSDNGYARPVEGLRPVVNLDTMEVIRVENYGFVPLPPNPGNYAAARMSSSASTQGKG
jgi:primary-amine oxidase